MRVKLIITLMRMLIVLGANHDLKFLSTKDMLVEQSNTEIGHDAKLAIDGKKETWSQTMSDDPDILGWWKVDFGVNYDVVGVRITSPSDPYDAYQLQQFEIKVLTDDLTEQDCITYTEAPFEADETKILSCSSVLQGRYIIVRKLQGSYRKDGIALSEVEIIVRAPTSTTTRSSERHTTVVNNVTSAEVLTTAEENIFTSTEMPTTDNISSSTFEDYTTPTSIWTTPIEPSSIPKKVTQIGSYGYHIADFAVDGDEATCSIACHPCDQSTSYGYGWWQYDFQSIVVISEVHILSCIHQHNANYLRDIIIGLSITNTTHSDQLTVCNENGNSQENIPTGDWLKFKCHAPIRGRYLTIIRKKMAEYRPDVISLAEIRVKDMHGDVINTTGITKGTSIDPITLKTKIDEGEWYKINLSNLTTSQVGTFENHESKDAIDGDSNTYAVACKECHQRIGIGWWQIYLEKIHKIVAVQITSSPADYDSNYLQEFAVEVASTKKDERLLCTEYINRTYVAPLTTMTLLCDKTLQGDTVIVTKTEYSSFRHDAIAIAEISIYAQT